MGKEVYAQKLKKLDFFHRKVNADAVKLVYGTRKIKINRKMPILLKLAQSINPLKKQKFAILF